MALIRLRLDGEEVRLKFPGVGAYHGDSSHRHDPFRYVSSSFPGLNKLELISLVIETPIVSNIGSELAHYAASAAVVRRRTTVSKQQLQAKRIVKRQSYFVTPNNRKCTVRLSTA